MSLNDLPALNATLNACSFFFLVLGYYLIKKKEEVKHRNVMCLALVFSTAFLISYLIYHYFAGHTVFPGKGMLKLIYLGILFSHIILAVVMVPLIVLTFFWAFTDRREKHKKVAKITWPIWSYVSLTGVIIYLMLYQMDHTV